MTVDVYPVCSSRGLWTFVSQPGVEPVRVRAPRGSRLRTIPGLRTDLSVPTADKRVRVVWSAGELMRAVEMGNERFKRIEPELAIV